MHMQQKQHLLVMTGWWRAWTHAWPAVTTQDQAAKIIAWVEADLPKPHPVAEKLLAIDSS